ncbi:hypothetical protein PUN28_016008 [Cardiocondyla obscurior]
MLGTNVCSDSQESALMDDETYKDIEKTFGGVLPLDVTKLEIPVEENPDHLNSTSSNVDNILKRHYKEEEEDDNHYYINLCKDFMISPFNLCFTFGDGSGQDWVYSETSKKMYIKMEKVLPLRFTWEPSTTGLFLRTELAFLMDEHKSEPVRRCYNHMAMTNCVNQTMIPDKIKHVVHCVNHPESLYDEKNEHLSILTPLYAAEAGAQYFPMCLKFFCKNSCQSGMNRRATELIFTLEDQSKNTLTRCTLPIRICSCPKRDKSKDETECTEPVKRRMLTSNMSSADKHVYKVELNVVGKENYLAVYKYAYDIMAGQAAKTGQHEFYKPYLDDILNKTP